MIKLQKEPKLKSPYLIAAWPGMGNVALKAATYLREKLEAEEFGDIQPAGFFHPVGASIKGNVVEIPKFPKSKFYYWIDRRSLHDLVIFLGEAQPSLEKEYEFACEILDLMAKFGVERVYTFAAMPSVMEHTNEPKVWAVVSHISLVKDLKDYGAFLMKEGQISGMNGLLLAVAKEKGFQAICLLGELPYYTIQIENPKSSKAVLQALCKMLGMEVDTLELDYQAKRIEEKIEKFVDYFKLPAQHEPKKPISDEEIEKIKESLNAHTRIPNSAKEKIQQLFREAKKDLSRARELKTELDKWDIYKEYEDKFLDLFKKGHH
jgi:proteasome assembly chaperone (PAC2) family protein